MVYPSTKVLDKSVKHSNTIRMKSKHVNTKSTTEGVRLSPDSWVKLRHLMQNLGRVWLEKAIDREYKKLLK